MRYETAGNYARILFIDFSSAFNTIQRHVMIDKQQKLEVPAALVHRVINFLSTGNRRITTNSSSRSRRRRTSHPAVVHELDDCTHRIDSGFNYVMNLPTVPSVLPSCCLNGSVFYEHAFI